MIINNLKRVGIFLKEIAFTLFLFIVGMTAVLESLRLTRKYPQDNWLSGPSGFMMIVGGLILFLCFCNLIQYLLQKIAATTKNNNENEESVDSLTGNYEQKANDKKMYVSFLVLVLYIFVIRYAGFAIASALYLFVSLLILKNPLRRVILTVAVILVLLLFGAPAIGISLPRGFMGI